MNDYQTVNIYRKGGAVCGTIAWGDGFVVELPLDALLVALGRQESTRIVDHLTARRICDLGGIVADAKGRVHNGHHSFIANAFRQHNADKYCSRDKGPYTVILEAGS